MTGITNLGSVTASGNGVIRVTDPETLDVIGEVAVSGPDDVDAALDRAHTAKLELPVHERCRLLSEVAQRVREDSEAFAILIASEGIKTIREARCEVERCAMTFDISAAETRQLGGQVIEMDQSKAGAGKLGIVLRESPGPVAAITPFNDPLNLVAHKLGPAIALGAPIVLKPHEATPLSAAKLHQTLIEVGTPPDLVQLVYGGAGVGRQLMQDHRPRVVSFTGGKEVGHQIASQSGFKKLLLELGGIGIVIVCEDADLELAASAIHAAAFSAAGQNCLHAQRVLVASSISGNLEDELVRRTQAMFLGPKKDERTDIGCCIDDAAVERIMGLLKRSEIAGGEILAGGTYEGRRIAPTWVRDCQPANPLAKEEVFGPVSLLEPVDSFDDMLRRLRLSDDTLHVAVFTASIQKAMAVFAAARAANVLVNESTDFRIDSMPFGGTGSAGLGREGIRYAIESMAETRMLVLPRYQAR